MGQLLTHVVCRTFGDDTIDPDDPLQNRLAGECVSAFYWRNLEGLEKGRRIMALPEGLEPVSDSFGRLWCDMDSLLRAEREPLQGLAVTDVPTVVVTKDTASSEMPDRIKGVVADLFAEPLDFDLLSDNGYPLPERKGKPAGQYTKYQLWDGSIAVGGRKTAQDVHEAGVRAEIERLRTEPQMSAADIS